MTSCGPGCWSGVLMLLLLWVPHSHAAAAQQALCGAEFQVVMCGQLPMGTAEYLRCCDQFQPMQLPPAALAAQSRAAASKNLITATSLRPDLDLSLSGRLSQTPNYLWDSRGNFGDQLRSCVKKGSLLIPAFAVPNLATVKEVTAPLLTRQQISGVKSRALMSSPTTRAVRRTALRLQAAARRIAGGNATTFLHPASLMGASEIAMMQHRLNSSTSPQKAARDSLLSGAGVPPKFYRYNESLMWYPPTDCPLSWSPGPYAMTRTSTKWGGWEEDTTHCPAQFPEFAPLGLCGHLSFVELDAQMAYKQAMAYLATKDVRYADNVLSTIKAWSDINKGWGMANQNGPLQAGWGVAALARSLEMLRGLPSFPAVRASFQAWFNTYLQPQMVSYVDDYTAYAVGNGNLNVYGNWHATIAEAWMSMAVLTDDVALFDKASELFVATTTNYLRWGRQPYDAGRTVGECTETLRDIYHSEFGLGSLLQAAEVAWQQDRDLFSTAGFALVAAMELHARIINAWDADKNEAMLPPGFKFYEVSMPAPPEGTKWVFDAHKQEWTARTPTGVVVSTLTDGHKYLLGVKWIPAGWEIGYNHFAGRLGLQLPETAAMLRRYPVEHYEMQWGSGTLSHADTAYELWRPGLHPRSLCV